MTLAERETRRVSLYARWINLSSWINTQLKDNLANVIQNDPAHRVPFAGDWMQQDVDAWASSAESVSRQIDERLCALLTDTHAFLIEAREMGLTEEMLQAHADSLKQRAP